MLRLIPSLTLGLALGLSACAGDDSGTTTASNATTTGNGTTASPGTGTDSPATGTDPDTTADPPGTTGDPGTTADPPGTTGEPPGTTGEPPGTTGELDACGMCVQDNCADELAACDMDPGCACFQECVQMNPGAVGAIACAGRCGVGIGDGPTGDLVSCSMNNCPKCL